MSSQGRQYPDGPLEVPPDWPEGAGHFLHAMLNGRPGNADAVSGQRGSTQPAPGPPYVHTLVPPEPLYWDDFGTPVCPEPGPAMTLTDAADSPYRGEVIQDTGNTGCYWPMDDAPA